MNELALDAAALVANGAWQGLALGAIAAGALRLLPGTNAATRHGIWGAAFVAAVAWPLVSLLVGFAPAGDAVRDPVVFAVAGDPAPSALQPATPAPTPAADPRLPLPALVATAVLGAWLTASLALLVRWFGGLLAMRRLKAASTPLPPDLDRRLAGGGHSGGRRHALRIRVSDRLASPSALGLGTPTVLLPRPLLDALSPRDLELITAHEAAHLRRFDDWSCCLQQLALALFPWSPALWWLDRRLAVERELAADAWAVSTTGATRRDYLRCLLDAAQAMLAGAHAAPAPALALAGRLEQRIDALLDGPAATPGGGAGRTAALVPVLGVLLALIAVGPRLGFAPWPLDAARPAEVMRGGGALEGEIARLAAADAAERAHAAHRLAQRRAGGHSAVPQLLALLDDHRPVPRSALTSRPWGRPSERAATTTPSEEAVKALLHVGRDALEPFEQALAERGERADPFARWALELLRGFD